MILSHRHRFIFIKGVKVAGTSAEIALSQICGPSDIITPVVRRDERQRTGSRGEPRNYTSHFYPAPVRRAFERRFLRLVDLPNDRSLLGRLHRRRFTNHMPLSEVLRRVPEANDYQLLFVERSPYAKVMSYANWAEHDGSYRQGGEIDRRPAALVDAVDRVISDGSVRRVLNIDRYRDLDGEVRAVPWTTTNLGSEIAAFFRSRGVAPIALTRAKQGANSDGLDPAKTLRDDQVRAINQIFSEEFELFGWPRVT